MYNNCNPNHYTIENGILHRIKSPKFSAEISTHKTGELVDIIWHDEMPEKSQDLIAEGVYYIMHYRRTSPSTKKGKK